MGAGTVAGVYGLALQQAAQEQGLGDAMAAAASALAAAFTPELVQRLENPRLSRLDAKNQLAGICQVVQAPTLVANFLCLLLDKHRLADASSILAEAAQAQARFTGRIPVTVTLATEPAPATRARLTQAVQTIVGPHCLVSFDTDAALVGGLKIRYDDTLIDGSVRRRLDDLSKLAHAAPVSDRWWETTAPTPKDLL